MYQKRNKELKIIALYRGNYKTRFYLREISKLTKIPLKTVQNVLNALESGKILRSKTEGKNKYFYLNLENIQTKYFLLHAEIYKTDVFLSAYPMFKSFLKSINSNAPIVVFGSYAKSKAKKDSDVDMLVISNKEQKIPFHLLPYKVHKIAFSKDVFEKALKEGEAIIKEIEENHIILNNHSYLVNVLWNHYGK